MEPIEHRSFIQKYVEPVVSDPGFFQIVEVAANCALVKLSLHLIKGASPKVINITQAVVLAPLAEELVFRGGLLSMIECIQILCNKSLLKRGPLREEEKLRQQKFRIHLSAFIFAAVHLINPHKSISSAFIQFIEAYLTGVSYAYLKEKYQFLSFSVLSHGIHNALCLPIQPFDGDNIGFDYHIRAKTAIFLVALIVHEIGVYLLATTDLDIILRKRLKEAAKFCAAIPENIKNYYYFPKLAVV